MVFMLEHPMRVRDVFTCIRFLFCMSPIRNGSHALKVLQLLMTVWGGYLHKVSPVFLPIEKGGHAIRVLQQLVTVWDLQLILIWTNHYNKAKSRLCNLPHLV